MDDPRLEEWMRDAGFRRQVREWLKDANPSRSGRVDDPAEIAERIRKLRESATAAIRPGDAITYADRSGVVHRAVATTGVRHAGSEPTVYVLDGAHVRELPASKVTACGSEVA